MNTQGRSFGTKLSNRILSWNLRRITTVMLIFAVAVGIVTSWFWYERVFLDEERRFWNAISTSMSTPSVVRTLTQGGTGNQVVQDYRFHFSPQQAIENSVDFINKSATEDVTIRTEGRIFPQEQYLRYTQFANVDAQGNEVSNIDSLIGEWAYQEGQGQGSSEEDNRVAFLSEYVTLAIFGNFGADYRAEVVAKMRDSGIYGNQLSMPTEQEVQINEGTRGDILVYQIRVKLKQYAQLLNDAFIKAGYGDFPPLNPDNYREDQTVVGQIVVSKNNGTIVGINFGGREERYSNYGIVKNIEKPEYNRTADELQQEVQEQL